MKFALAPILGVGHAVEGGACPYDGFANVLRCRHALPGQRDLARVVEQLAYDARDLGE